MSTPHRIPTARTLLALALAGTLAAPLAGCSSGSPGGAAASADRAGAAAGAARAGVSPRPSGAGSTPGSASGSAGSGPLRAAIRATGSCDTPALLAHTALASGAVHRYLAREDAHGRVTVVALGSAAARRTAAKAAGFAAAQLTSGQRAVAGCAGTANAAGTSRQTADYLDRLAARLRTGRASVDQVTAAEALVADVGSQLSLLRLAVTDRVPPAGSL